jgi:hypothetical protein
VNLVVAIRFLLRLYVILLQVPVVYKSLVRNFSYTVPHKLCI